MMGTLHRRHMPNGSVVVTDTRDLVETQAAAIAAIKAEAGGRILAAFPLHVQLNAQARATELLLAASEGGWTPDEAAEAAALQAMRNAIKAMRAASNEAEARVLAAATNAEVDAVAPAWPEAA